MVVAHFTIKVTAGDMFFRHSNVTQRSGPIVGHQVLPLTVILADVGHVSGENVHLHQEGQQGRQICIRGKLVILIYQGSKFSSDWGNFSFIVSPVKHSDT